MNKNIDNIKKTRLFLLNAINDLSADQLNKIPAGFNNNIIWNLGHMIAAQQSICYIRAGVLPVVEKKYITEYKPGTKPEQHVDAAEIQKIKDLMLSTLDRLATDRETNVFCNYTTWTIHYGAKLASIDEAIVFLPYHEGLHSGIIITLKKLVSK